MFPKSIKALFLQGNKLDIENALFQCAFDFAESGLRIWFISPLPVTRLPEDVKAPDKETLKLITFLYLKDHKDLLTHLNGIQLWRNLPEMIILNGYENYCMFTHPNHDLSNSAFITASILDAASTCARKHGKEIPLLVSSSEANAEVGVLVDMYFHSSLYCSDKTVKHIKDYFC